MAFLDRFRPNGNPDPDAGETAPHEPAEGQREQLAPDDDRADVDDQQDGTPRGEDRTNRGQSLIRTLMPGGGHTGSQDYTVETDKSRPPATITRYWQDYFHDFPLTRAPLRIFDEAVAEPGYRIEATVDQPTGETDSNGEPITETVTDDDMQAALREWASECAWHAHESGHDLGDLIRGNPSKRRGKGTLFMEIVRAESGIPTGLIYHDPASFKIYSRENQAALVQPDDDVADDHPRDDTRTDEYPDGKAAAYVQYDDALDGYDDEDPVAFAADDIIKFVYEPDTGDPWGSSIYESGAERIDALKQKLRDRDGSIRLAGYPLRVYSSPQWTPDEASEWADHHEEGELSTRQRERRSHRLQYGPRNTGVWGDYAHGTRDSSVYDPADNPLARSTEFIGGELNIDVVQGDVADIGDAVLDDVRMIFADMPVARLKIAYEENINQFVAEPQRADDERRVNQEREYLARKFEPVFEELANHLAAGDGYDGDVRFAIEPSPESNPLEREDFPRENLDALAGAVKELNQAGADSALVDGILTHAGLDVDDIRKEYGDEMPIEEFAPEASDEVDESDTSDESASASGDSASSSSAPYSGSSESGTTGGENNTPDVPGSMSSE